MADETKKIFIDDDWKRQAQEEKHRLAEQEKQAQEKATAPKREGRAAPSGEPRQLPPASFEALVSTFMTQTLLALGLVDHPEARRMVNLELAKFNIDLLAMIEQKTKGNLTSQEADLLDQTLHQLRMAFVEVASAHAGPIGAQ